MEKLGDILKKKKTKPDTQGENTDIWSINETEPRDGMEEKLCPICHGARFVHPVSASGKPDYRRAVPCTCTNVELEKDKQDRLQKYSNLGSLSRLTFDKLYSEGRIVNGSPYYDFKKAFDAALEFAQKPQGWLIIVGPNGCGKTHLACAIANFQLNLGLPVFYIEVANLLDHLRAAFRPDSAVEYDELFEQIRNTPLLVLDDLSITTITPWAKEKIQQLLNHRYNERMPTVITSSTNVEDLDKALDCHLSDPDVSRVFVIRPKSLENMRRFGGLELDLIKQMLFKNFDYKRLNLSADARQNLEQAFRITYNFAQSPQGWIILLGENGCGKTHLAAAVANHLCANQKDVMFIVVPDFLDYLRSTFGPDRQVSYDEIFEKVKKSTVLILDDFGGQSVTPWSQEKLYQLINYRYNARLATIITTCFSLDEIESRISSRMVDPSISLVFHITAPDYRGDRRAASKKVRSNSRNKLDTEQT
jgi:DNA replication protein DnaC